MGIQEDSQQLRRLARAVMAGDLLPEEYRRQRRVVIDRYAGDGPVAGQPLAAVVVAPAVPSEHTMPNGRTMPTVPYSRDTDDITRIGSGGAGATRDPDRPPDSVVERRPEDGTGSGRDLVVGVIAVALVVAVVAGLLAYLM
jgi:hypothetical protein